MFFSFQTAHLASITDRQTDPQCRVAQPQPAHLQEPGAGTQVSANGSQPYTCSQPAPGGWLHRAEFCHFVPMQCQCHLAAAPELQFQCCNKWIRDLSGCQVNHHYYSRYHLAHTPHGSQLLVLQSPLKTVTPHIKYPYKTILPVILNLQIFKMSDNLSSELHCCLKQSISSSIHGFWLSGKRPEEVAFLHLLTNVLFVFRCKKLIFLCATVSSLDITTLNGKHHLSLRLAQLVRAWC